MKTETIKQVVKHPELGNLTKEFKYTYDETKYSSLKECIADHEAMEEEKNKECRDIEAANQEESKRVALLNEKNLSEWMAKKPEEIKPVFKKLDGSKYAGRGYASKELNVAETKPNILEIINSMSKEEIDKLKTLLK